MRCSFGNVPLEYMESTVSSNTFINQVALNGEFALKNAYKEYKKNKIDTCFNSNLKQHNFKTMLDAIEMYTGKRSEQNIDSLFTATTPINKELQQSPPNVIIIQVESMSGFYFNLHTPELNLLGDLEEELKYCTVFHNFLPCRDFTIFTLDGLLINSPKSPLSQSQFLNKSFSTSAVLPFKNAGYNTTFITGGRMNWRNLDMFLPRQGFDECEGGTSIQKYYPNAKEEHEWGLYDEFMFNRMGDILETKSDKPHFIYAMTITNHTPFKIPDNYKMSSITYKESLLPHFKGNNERLLQTFKCYQYANDCLGKFIKRIRNSPAGKNTIIVAFGDHAEHNLGDFFSLTDKTLFQKNAVPCIFYIPEKYRKNLKIDTTRYGSHRDIFPTLYSLALSNSKYIKSGNNLFSDQPESSFTALFNYNLAMDKNGCVLFNNDKPVYLHWKNQATHELDYNNKPNKELIELYNKSRAYSCLINELIRLQLKK
jgi:phosphoglycerol transferase MdoB-like AlkP superfamily enzyme